MVVYLNVHTAIEQLRLKVEREGKNAIGPRVRKLYYYYLTILYFVLYKLCALPIRIMKSVFVFLLKQRENNP